MKNLSARLLAAACVGALVTCATAGTVEAQFDHLKCYKAKDQKTFKSARADITALQTQFGVAEDCQIKAKAKLFCVPASKTVTSIEEGTDSPFPAEELGFDRLCYSIKCPKVDIASEEVSDQFGTRQVEKFKAAMLCTPAVKGPPPSECVDLDGDGYGAGCENGADCDDASEFVNPGAAEVCDNIDNDCNGMVDDGLGGTPCDGPDSDLCEEGVLMCIAGTFVCDDATGDNVETCNMIDDDCDGAVDEDFDLSTDPNNCGTCGTVCPPGETPGICVAGSCQ